MYKLYKYLGEVVGAIKTDGNTQTIFEFKDPDNTDYQAYLAWCKEGNTPLPAENE